MTLTWSAPFDGGTPITGYAATASPGGFTCATSGLSCTVTGLTNGTSYSFTVKATNAVGTGAASNALSATPTSAATVPGAPNLLSALRGNGLVTLSWAAPASDGGSPITSYTATSSPGGLTCTSASASCTVTGLTNGTTYSFTVKATNACRHGPRVERALGDTGDGARRTHTQHRDRGSRAGDTDLVGPFRRWHAHHWLRRHRKPGRLHLRH